MIFHFYYDYKLLFIIFIWIFIYFIHIFNNIYIYCLSIINYLTFVSLEQDLIIDIIINICLFILRLMT
jgi:hypothetical protein